MPSNRPLERLREILDRAEAGLRDLGILTYEAYLGDIKAQDVLERNILRIAEAASKVGLNQLERTAPGAPWKSLYAMSNRLRHGYDRVDHAIVWDTFIADFPMLKAAATAEIKRLSA